jgi:hypothetical protein
MGQLAAQWLNDQAREELTKVEKVQAELDRMGHSIPDAPALLERARQAMERGVQHRRNREHSEAYAQAEVALRSLRLLMRANWEKAVHNLDSPVCSPYAVSFYTLPKHWRMLDQMKQMHASATILPDGDFEVSPYAEQKGWYAPAVSPHDDVYGDLRRVTTGPHGGKQCLKMEVTPKDSKREPAALERTYVVLHSPEVSAKPGTLVRISAWVKLPGTIKASTDGAMFFDSAGGEPLAMRLVESTGNKWKKVTLYRKVPPSGKLYVTMALSGIGTVYFDDVRIEPLVAGAATTARARSGK